MAVLKQWYRNTTEKPWLKSLFWGKEAESLIPLIPRNHSVQNIFPVFLPTQPSYLPMLLVSLNDITTTFAFIQTMEVIFDYSLSSFSTFIQHQIALLLIPEGCLDPFLSLFPSLPTISLYHHWYWLRSDSCHFSSRFVNDPITWFSDYRLASFNSSSRLNKKDRLI